MKGILAGFSIVLLAALALLAGPAGPASAVICPPPPCQPSSEIVCPLQSSAIAIYPCGCPIVLTSSALPVLDGCVDLAVTERVDRATAVVGDRLTYAIEVRNGGPDTATGVTVTDPLPAGVALFSAAGPSGSCDGGPAPACALGALGPGEAATATVVARATQPGEIANTVTASAIESDLDPSNNQATATTHVDPATAAPPPRRPPARSSWCSPSGDVCYGRLRGRGPIRLGLTLAARYFKHYRLCVTGPSGSTTCKRFRVHRRGGGSWGSIVRWHGHFPDLGPGSYQVGWSSRSGPLGPGLEFTT